MARKVLTDQNITECMDAAGYGIGYWVRTATVDHEARTYTITPHEDPFKAEDDGKPYVITYDQLSDAYYKLIALDQELVGDRDIHSYFIDSYIERDQNGIDCGHIDAAAGDVWVQVAAFGEIVFG